MVSIPYLVATLYPEKTQEEMQGLIDRVVSVDTREFYEKEWRTIEVKDLPLEEVQLRLIKTLFQSQFGYWGVISEIFSFFDTLNDNGVPRGLIGSKERDFYARWTTFTGFLHFASLPRSVGVGLLNGEELLLACVWDTPIIDSVTAYFTRFTFLNTLQFEAALFAEAIAQNKQQFGGKSIGEWVRDFRAFQKPERPATAADDYFVDNMEVERLPEKDREILHKIISLYFLLQTGAIYRDIVAEVPPGFEGKTPQTEVDFEDMYIQRLFEVEDVLPWLEDEAQVLYWIVQTRKTEKFMKALLFILSQKVNLNDAPQREKVLDLLQKLGELGLENVDELVYFDEKENKFVWDEPTIISFEVPDPEKSLIKK